MITLFVIYLLGLVVTGIFWRTVLVTGDTVTEEELGIGMLFCILWPLSICVALYGGIMYVAGKCWEWFVRKVLRLTIKD